MGDFLRLPEWVETPDFSHVTDPFEGERLPGGSLNPWDMGNDWFQRNILGNGEPHCGSDGSVQRDDVSLHTPDYVRDHREALGMSEHTPDRDFITEVIAHQVTGESDTGFSATPENRRSAHVARMHELEQRDDLSSDERDELEQWNQQAAQLRSWGYNPEITEANEVFNEETGLYAVRYDPLREGDEGFDPEAHYDPNRGSITSFAGTHSLQDGRVDFDREVGSLQYERNREEIQRLIDGGNGDRQTLTGHSLGGYLAQRAAVDATDDIQEVVTYQAGGLSHEHAQQFEQNRGDIAVRHHSSAEDFVHLAGEERLRGDTFHHHSDDHAFGHLYTLMCGTDDDVMHSTGVDEGTTDGWDEQDRRLLEMGRRGLSGYRHAHGVTTDMLWYGAEGAGRQLDRAAGHGVEALEHVAEGGGNALRHALGAGGEAIDAISEGDGTRTLDALTTGAMNVGTDGVRTAGALANEAVETVADLAVGGRREAAHMTDHFLDQGTELVRDLASNGETATDFAMESARRNGRLARATGESLANAGHAVADAAIGTGANLVEGASNAWNSLWD